MVVRSVASEGGALFVGVGFAVGVDVGMNNEPMCGRPLLYISIFF